MIPDEARQFDRAAAAQGVTRRLLIAEDNVANQKVAAAMVAKLGFEADVVANGVEAVEAFQRTEYAAVLMDCHMPVMDGYAATAGIRAVEHGERRIPIIALTASVVGAVKEKCLSAGMDDYVSKPVMLDELGATLSRWVVGESEPVAAERRNAPPQRSSDPFDAARVASLRESNAPGRPDMFNHFARMFVDEAASQVAALGQALADEEWEAVRHHAHTLRGGAATFGATDLADQCGVLEERLLADTAAAPNAFPAIKAEFERVRSWLSSRKQSDPPPPAD